MKKLISILLVVAFVFSLCGCGNANVEETVEETATETVEETIEETVEEHFYWNICYEPTWDYLLEQNNGAPYYKDIVPNEEAAIAIAKTVLSNVSAHYQAHSEELTKIMAFYVHKHNMWIVHFSVETPDSFGGGVWVAIQKDNGQILKIHVTE